MEDKLSIPIHDSFYKIACDLHSKHTEEEINVLIKKAIHGNKKVVLTIKEWCVYPVTMAVIKLYSRLPNTYIYLDPMELINVVYLKLDRTIQTFDSSKGFKFTSYLQRMIHNNIVDYVHRTHITQVKNRKTRSQDKGRVYYIKAIYDEGIKKHIPDSKDYFKDYIFEDIVRYLLGNLEGRTKLMVEDYLEGYNWKEVARRNGLRRKPEDLNKIIRAAFEGGLEDKVKKEK